MSEAAVQVPETKIIVLFPPKAQGGESEGQKPRLQKSEPQVPQSEEQESEYAKDWTCAADGIYRYNPSGTYYYRPVGPDGRRTRRSLKTKNLKIAIERYQKLKSTQGNIAESKLTAGEIIAKYEEDEKRRPETEGDEKRHCEKLKKFWTTVRVADICDATFRNYFKWRTKPENLTYGKGRRITDRELNMRAWYVLVRRSQGASDAQIAMELGHTSGGACIASTYGGVPDEWRKGGGPNMSWVPKKFAWEDL